jgi:integrase/recombinase XerD
LKIFTDEEIDLLLDKPKSRDSFTDWRTWTIISWVLATGNRAATICEVKMGDVDYKSKEIHLRHTKNKKAQTIPLSSSLEVCLKEYIRIWRKEAGAEEWLFPNVGEEQLTTNALRHSFSRYCAARGVDKSNIHGLRHSFARAWIRNNGSTFQLQKILGHSTLEMTRRYVRLFSEDLKQDFDKFSPLDNIKKNSKRTKTISRN